jgi:hypothetical protein
MVRTMRLVTEPYREQLRRWPVRGRHILAQFDDEGPFPLAPQAFGPRTPAWGFPPCPVVL